MSYLASLAVLAVFLIFAFNNRFLARELYGPKVGVYTAHCVGVALQVLFIFALTYLLLAWLGGSYSRADLWAIGVTWAVLGDGIELWYLRAVQRQSWSGMLAEYDLRRGRLWWLVPPAMLVAPVVVHDWLLAA
jgi:hypothetical protein